MNQRGFAFLGIAPYIIGAFAVVALVGTVAWKWNSFKESLREEGRAEVRVEWQAERTALVAARDAMVMRWAKAVQEVERVYVEKVVERESRFGAIRSRAAGASVSGAIRLSPGAVGVLRESASAANGESAPVAGEGAGAAPPVPEPAGDTTAQEWIAFAVDAAEAYADAREKWQACVAWSGAIRDSQEGASNVSAPQ